MKYDYSAFNVVFADASEVHEFEIESELIEFVSGSGYLYVRLDSMSNDEIPLEKRQLIPAPFKRFYLRASAAGTVTIFVSSHKDIRIGGSKVDVNSIDYLEKTQHAVYGNETITSGGGVINAVYDSERRAIHLYNLGPSVVYAGVDESVTTSNGYPIPVNGEKVFERYNSAIYLIVASGSADVRYFNEGES